MINLTRTRMPLGKKHSARSFILFSLFGFFEGFGRCFLNFLVALLVFCLLFFPKTTGVPRLKRRWRLQWWFQCPFRLRLRRHRPEPNKFGPQCLDRFRKPSRRTVAAVPVDVSPDFLNGICMECAG